MNQTPDQNSYDDVPYDSYPYQQSHPSKLATMATLFGLAPPDVSKCRVLELGCAAGGNIIPIAEAFPDAWLVGVDFSARQIAEGEQLIRRSGLTNVSLRHASIGDIDDTYGPFDYIICHGVFSWVPRDVQQKIFEVCASRLAPNGVAYVSYNTYPGWHMRGMIRDMMRYHAFRFDQPEQRIGQARALLDFLAQSTQKDTGAYGVLLRAELELLKNQSDHYIYHEQLEDINEPVYFHQFVARAEPFGLRYFGESRINTMITGNFGPEIQKTLAVLATDQIQAEQYLDFVRNRTFRETLLVRAEMAPNWAIVPERIYGLHVASGAKATGKPIDLASVAQTASQFQSPSGMVLSATGAVFKAAMLCLIDKWPATIPFVELLQLAVAKLGRVATNEDLQTLAVGILNSYISSDLLELHAVPLTFVRTPGEKPVALVHARVQAAEGRASVTNRRHELVKLSDIALRLVPLLDGTRDRDEIVEALVQQALAGQLTVRRHGQPLTDANELRTGLTVTLGPTLDALAHDALLIQ